MTKAIHRRRAALAERRRVDAEAEAAREFLADRCRRLADVLARGILFADAPEGIRARELLVEGRTLS
jgi:hypothetical protein